MENLFAIITIGVLVLIGIFLLYCMVQACSNMKVNNNIVFLFMPIVIFIGQFNEVGTKYRDKALLLISLEFFIIYLALKYSWF